MVLVAPLDVAVPEGVVNWWYHYYAHGYGIEIVNPRPIHFTVSTAHETPDFSQYRYKYRICHPQLGSNVKIGRSIVLIKTVIGASGAERPYLSSTAFIVGYFRVIRQDENWLYMDPNDSLLLLENPIQVNLEWARRLLPSKPPGYWTGEQLVAKFGRSTRNCHINSESLRPVLWELS